MKHSSSNAFTLIELMVVVGIIAVLTALLMPAVTSGIKRANSAKCLSNLRQIGVAVRQYIADPANNQAYPPICSSNVSNTNMVAGPAPANPTTPAAALGQYGFTNTLIFCPADTNKANSTNSTVTNYGSYSWAPIMKTDQTNSDGTTNANCITTTNTGIYNTGGALQIPSASIMTICADSVSRHPGKNNGTVNILRLDGHVETQ